MFSLNAPLVPLTEIDPHIYAKIEYLHPSGSIKHRALPAIIESRRRSGLIRPGQRIAVLSAGSAAVAVAWAAARLGHPALGVLPRGAPPHIARLLAWMGAACERIDATELKATIEVLSNDPGTYLLSQASDPELPSHYGPVAQEILDALPDVEAITVGIGTGATITGIGRQIKRAGSRCCVAGVEPAEAQVASGAQWAPHTLHGLAPPLPQLLLDRSVLDTIVPVPSIEGWKTAQRVHHQVGLPIGPSSGAAVAAALTLRARGVRGTMVAVCSCSMSEYLEMAPAM